MIKLIKKSDSKESDAARIADLAQQYNLTFKCTGMIYRFENFTACGLDQALGYVEGYDRAMAACRAEEADV